MRLRPFLLILMIFIGGGYLYYSQMIQTELIKEAQSWHDKVSLMGQGKYQVSELKIKRNILHSTLHCDLSFAQFPEFNMVLDAKIYPGPVWHDKQGWHLGRFGVHNTLSLGQDLIHLIIEQHLNGGTAYDFNIPKPIIKLMRMLLVQLKFDPVNIHLSVDKHHQLETINAAIKQIKFSQFLMPKDVVTGQANMEWGVSDFLWMQQAVSKNQNYLSFCLNVVALNDSANFVKTPFELRQLKIKMQSAQQGKHRMLRLDFSMPERDQNKLNLYDHLPIGPLKLAAKIIYPMSLEVKKQPGGLVQQISYFFNQADIKVSDFELKTPIATVAYQGNLNVNTSSGLLIITPKSLPPSSETFWSRLNLELTNWLDNANEEGWLLRRNNEYVFDIHVKNEDIQVNGVRLAHAFFQVPPPSQRDVPFPEGSPVNKPEQAIASYPEAGAQ